MREAAAVLRQSGVAVRVVSMPCWDLFEAQSDTYRASVLPAGVPALAVEAACSFGWDRYADATVCIDRFGASAPGGLVLEKLGINVDNVVAKARICSAVGRHPDIVTHVIEECAMNRLHELYERGGQSPWLDNLKRGYITGGELQRWVDRGVRGITSNPSIFQKAISGGADYHAQFQSLLQAGASIEDSYWQLVTKDITDALAIMRPVFDESHGADGFVSVEVDPSLARDTPGTIKAAQRFRSTIKEPNLYVKIPATAEGVPAIRHMISEGCSINVTLIFSLDRYTEVIDAYLDGLEARTGDLSTVNSVASFFVSRVDTEVDRRLGAIGTPAALRCVARPRWRKRRWRMSCSPNAFVVRDGIDCVLAGPDRNGHCGHRRRPRIRRIATRCMSTR